MKTETKSESGSPDPTVQGKDGETAGTESEQNVKNVCPGCGSPKLRFGSRDPCEGDYYWCNVCGFGPILFPLYHAMPVASIPNEQPCPQCLKGTMFLAVEDDGSLWYVCNNKCCMYEIEVKTLTDCARCPDLTKCGAHITGGTVQQCAEIIDAEESNRALQIVAQLKRKTTHDAITSIQRAHGLVGRGL